MFAMDTLSDLLELLRPQTSMSGGFDMGGNWSVRFPEHDGIKLFALSTGCCWLTVEGTTSPLQVVGGDCFLLPQGRPFTLCNDLTLTPMDGYAAFPRPLQGSVREWNGGGGCSGVGGYFHFADGHAAAVLKLLPPFVKIERQADKTAMRWYLEQLMSELREPQPAAAFLRQQLAFMTLAQALRHEIVGGMNEGVGRLAAFADRQIGPTIRAMHQDCGRPWTLRSLAGHAGMSRSAFALRFKQAVGVSPIEYLTTWRMAMARHHLLDSRRSLSQIAADVGYKSESAFSAAFQRVMGCPPGRYSRIHSERP